MTCVVSDYSLGLLDGDETATFVVTEFNVGFDAIVIDDNSVDLLVFGNPVIIVHLDDVLDFVGVFALLLLGHGGFVFGVGFVIVLVTAQSVNRVDFCKVF